MSQESGARPWTERDAGRLAGGRQGVSRPCDDTHDRLGVGSPLSARASSSVRSRRPPSGASPTTTRSSGRRTPSCPTETPRSRSLHHAPVASLRYISRTLWPDGDSVDRAALAGHMVKRRGRHERDVGLHSQTGDIDERELTRRTQGYGKGVIDDRVVSAKRIGLVGPGPGHSREPDACLPLLPVDSRQSCQPCYER